jgi:hypothetical protein
VEYWNSGWAGAGELNALFVGTYDQSVKNVLVAGTPGITPGTPSLYEIQQTAYSNNFQVLLYEDATLDYNAPTLGPAGRTGNYTYKTITDGTATMVFEANGMSTITNLLNPAISPVEHTSTIYVRMNDMGTATLADDVFVQVISGSGTSFLEIADADGIGGTVGLGWDTNSIDLGLGVFADLKMTWDLDSVTTGSPWDIADNDPVRGAYVPEPVTMAGMLLGIGCLSRYIRKRR